MEAIPKITAIILARNEEKKIERCIDSIIQLDYPKDRLEIILIDSNSTDNTISIAEKYNIRILKLLKPNFGTAINVGVENAKGYYLLKVDGDSTVPKNFLRNAIKEMYMNPNVALVGGMRRERNPSTDLGQIYHNRFQADKFGEQLVVSGNYVFDLPKFRKYIKKLPETNCAEDLFIGIKYSTAGFKSIRIKSPAMVHDSSYEKNSILSQARKTIFQYTHGHAMVIKSLFRSEIKAYGLKYVLVHFKLVSWVLMLVVISCFIGVKAIYIGLIFYIFKKMHEKFKQFDGNGIWRRLLLGFTFGFAAVLSSVMFWFYLFIPFPKRGRVVLVK